MRSPLTPASASSARAAAYEWAGGSRAVGSRQSAPLITSRSSAASAASRAMGPTWDRALNELAGYSGTRPYVGLSPNAPQNEAGMRIEPPPSVPSESGAAPAATAAALPPLEPPAVRVGSCGLRVTPVRGNR